MVRTSVLVLSPLLLSFLVGTAVLPGSASAEDWRGIGWVDRVSPVAQDIIQDDRGRRYLVDRRTGRVIERLWREEDWLDQRYRDRPPRHREEFFEGDRWDEDAYYEPRYEQRFEDRFQQRLERRLQRRALREERQRMRALRRQERLDRQRERRLANRPWAQDQYEDAPLWEPRERVKPVPQTRPRPNDALALGVEPKVERGALEPLEPRGRGQAERSLNDQFGAGQQPVRPQTAMPALDDAGDVQQPVAGGETQVASLPNEPAPLQSVEPIASLSKPPYGPTRMMELQIVLDRAGFSPGVIDGQWGTNVEKALSAYKLAKGKGVDLRKPAQLAKALSESGGAALTSHTLTAKDVSGPFVTRIPIDYARKAQMTSMAYTSVVEKLAEKFHVTEAALKALNPAAAFRPGETIQVPSVGAPVQTKVHYLVADKEQKQVRAYDRNGKLVAAYPATIGSRATPSPSGTHAIARVAFNPQYTYDPKKNFKQGTNDKVLVVPPGPNGPVGSVWIALSKDSYGIHGTPRPDQIGKTKSNGCIRLTNWDANELARLVRAGVTVEFKG
ncbi:MAG: L,D-transpeptidase [Pseudomonadota bacterium]